MLFEKGRGKSIDVRRGADTAPDMVTTGTQAIRAECVARLLLRGMSRRAIHDWTVKSGWGLSSRTVDRLIRRAGQVLEKEADATVNIRAEFLLAKTRLEMLFTAALDTRDGQKPNIRAALACQRELNRLLGLASDGNEQAGADEPISFNIVGVKDQDEDAAPDPAPVDVGAAAK
jgi:hypothetical protein